MSFPDVIFQDKYNACKNLFNNEMPQLQTVAVHIETTREKINALFKDSIPLEYDFVKERSIMDWRIEELKKIQKRACELFNCLREGVNNLESIILSSLKFVFANVEIIKRESPKELLKIYKAAIKFREEILKDSFDIRMIVDITNTLIPEIENSWTCYCIAVETETKYAQLKERHDRELVELGQAACEGIALKNEIDKCKKESEGIQKQAQFIQQLKNLQNAQQKAQTLFNEFSQANQEVEQLQKFEKQGNIGEFISRAYIHWIEKLKTKDIEERKNTIGSVVQEVLISMNSLCAIH